MAKAKKRSSTHIVKEKVVCVRGVIPPEGAGFLAIPLASMRPDISAAIRLGASLVKVGRPRIDPALIAELRADLRAYWHAGGKKGASLSHVQARLKAKGLSMKPNTIKRKIIWD
jgi:hypothetical protein